MSFFDNLDRYMFNRVNEFLRPDLAEDSAPTCLYITNGDNKQVAPLPRRGVLNAKMDLLEKPDAFLVHVELPGVRKEDIQVHVENGMLSLMAERKEEKKEDKDRYHYSERRYGSIKRMVSLPEQADPDNVKAEFENGVLCLSFAKKPENASRKQINIA